MERWRDVVEGLLRKYLALRVADQDGGAAARVLSGGNVGQAVANQDGLGQVNAVAAGGLVEQAGLGFAAGAGLAVFFDLGMWVVNAVVEAVDAVPQLAVELVVDGFELCFRDNPPGDHRLIGDDEAGVSFGFKDA